MDSLGSKALCDYLFARGMIGKAFALPRVGRPARE